MSGQDTLSIALKQYSPLVRRLANQMMAKMPPNIQIDDLIQVGMIGLADALTRFDLKHGAKLETFATQRVRGAMLDELRNNDYLSRGARRMQRSIESTMHSLRHKLGRIPVESEIAREMGVTLTEYLSLLGGAHLMYLEDLGGNDDNDFLDRHNSGDEGNPLNQLQDHRMRSALVEAIKMLPERDQYLMSRYYEHDQTLKEIAEVLGISGSRACQIHRKTVARLRVKLRAH